MSYDLYYLFILPDWHGVDYVGEVDMEQEEQAPAVGVLKTRCKSIFVNKRIFLFKQSKYDIILFDDVYCFMPLWRSSKK